jgi:hypothetical protein
MNVQVPGAVVLVTALPSVLEEVYSVQGAVG